MGFATLITVTLALTGSALAISQLTLTPRPRGQKMDNGDKDFIDAYISRGNYTLANATASAETAPNDTVSTVAIGAMNNKFPIWKLPECYRGCIDANCCNAIG
ncbi:Uu.00g085720.m01.CDS01, partial [Anthostomella pinea]